MPSFHPSILREYDIRGVVNTTLFPLDLYHVGRLVAQMVHETTKAQPRLIVGYDGRLSSPELAEALYKGLLSEKAHVVSIGCGPTPMTSFSHYLFESDGVLMITGSHNPSSYNGVKITLYKKPFYGQKIQNLQERVKALKDPASQVYNAFFEERDIRKAYVDCLLKGFSFNTPLSVVWDTGNGAAGEIVEALVKRLPGHHILLNTKIDGTFPAHHPDPTVEENLEEMRAAILENQADLGFAFDGDGDRLGVMDGKGRIVWGDQMMIFFAKSVLKKCPGAAIIGDVKASQILFDQITSLGGRPVMSKTGHSLIKSKMQELKAPLAGEMSGHIFFNDRYFGYDDALYAALRMLEFIQEEKRPLSQLYEGLPHCASTPEIRIDVSVAQKKEILEKIKEDLIREKIAFNDLDGVRVSFKKGWWGLRASNTQEVITLRVEAENTQELEHLKADLFNRLKPFGILM